MKTKIIPFDLEMAKKIQAGEIEGKIKTKTGHNVRIVCFNKLGDKFPIVALIDFSCKEDLLEHPYLFTNTGICDYIGKDLYDLVLEVPDNEPQFKPFDKVLVKSEDKPTLVCPKCLKPFHDCRSWPAYHNREDYECPHCGYIADSANFRTSYSWHPYNKTPKHEFKVGDKVKVVKLPFDSMYDGAYLGKEFVIKEVKTTIAGDYVIGKDGWKDNSFPADCLELVGKTEYEFKPFDKVLVKIYEGDRCDERWVCDIFSHIEGKYVVLISGAYENLEMIPYEGNEHLVGTTNNPE